MTDIVTAARGVITAIEDTWKAGFAPSTLRLPYAPGGFRITRLNVHTESIHLALALHDQRRLGDTVCDNVLSVEAIEVAEPFRGQGLVTTMIAMLLEGEPAPRIPLRFLHFKDCGPGLSSLLSRLHFHRYLIGGSVDWWRPVTGQKELPL